MSVSRIHHGPEFSLAGNCIVLIIIWCVSFRCVYLYNHYFVIQTAGYCSVFTVWVCPCVCLCDPSCYCLATTLLPPLLVLPFHDLDFFFYNNKLFFMLELDAHQNNFNNLVFLQSEAPFIYNVHFPWSLIMVKHIPECKNIALNLLQGNVPFDTKQYIIGV